MQKVVMILNLILLGLFVYRSLNISGETVFCFEKGIDVSPIVAIVLVLANNIKKDEDLVKSADRLR
jgi:hypothetical protein